MFNRDQLEYMEFLSKQSPETLCYCGWYKLGECYNCRRDHPNETNADKLAAQPAKGEGDEK